MTLGCDRAMPPLELVNLCVPVSHLFWVISVAELWLTTLLPSQAISREVPVTAVSSPPGIIVPATVSTVQSPFPSFNNPQLEQQLQRYAAFVKAGGPPDVLVVGSSRAVQGVDPLALQWALIGRGYANARVFNLGVNGATAQVVEVILHRLLSPEALPRLILWADGARALNSGRSDRTYQNIVRSDGYRRLTQGWHPTWKSGVLPFGTLCLGLAGDRPLRPPTQGLTPPRFNTFSPPGTPVCSHHLRWLLTSSHLDLSWQTASTWRTDLGFQAIATRFQPTTYFQRYPRVPGDFDGDYRNFSLAGEQSAAFYQVLQLAHQHRIPLVFVNLPMTGIYLDATRSYYEQRFRRFMQQSARSRQFTFYDFSQRWLHQHGYFTDPSHLNQYGGWAIAYQIAPLLLPHLSR